jgi:hypothetical protein
VVEPELSPVDQDLSPVDQKMAQQKAKRAERARRRLASESGDGEIRGDCCRYHEMSVEARHEFNAKRAHALKMARLRDVNFGKDSSGNSFLSGGIVQARR